MNSAAKIAIIVLCFSLCGAGAFVASTVREKTELQKTGVIPVKNRHFARRVWIEV